MGATYDNALAKPLDQVRFLIQDTNTSSAKFQDEEILWSLDTAANVYMAAADLCDILIARAGSVSHKKIGPLSISYDIKFYRALAGGLRARGAGHQVPFAGGISVSDKTAQKQDTDWVQPSVQRGIDDNPAAPAPQVPSNNPLTSI